MVQGVALPCDVVTRNTLVLPGRREVRGADPCALPRLLFPPSPMPSKRAHPTTRNSNERRLNLRLLTWVAVPTLLLVLGVSQLHRVQIKRNSIALLEQSRRAESNGDLVKAENYLRLFLGYQPNHAEALARYGLIRAVRARSVDDQIQTIQALERALRVDPDRRDVRRRLVDVAMSLKSFAVARMHLEKLLGPHEPGKTDAVRPSTPENGELEYLLGQCAEGEADYKSAARWYKDAVTHAPERIEAYLRLADVLRNPLRDPSTADRVMDAATSD